MKKSLSSVARKLVHQTVRAALALLPRALRFAVYRAMVDCDPQPDPRLTLKIADTQDELEACFGLLHDAYVSAGFMVPQPSGLRVTIYHALPTTTTLCAKWDGQVVGTISMIREGVFGFPLQSVFNLSGLRSRSGNIAEISALAIAPDLQPGLACPQGGPGLARHLKAVGPAAAVPLPGKVTDAWRRGHRGGRCRRRPPIRGATGRIQPALT
jgi:hypothetical protein